MQLCLISFWVTYLIEEIGMSLLQAGVALSIAQTCGVLGRIVWGALSDRFVKPNIMLGLLGIGMTLCSLSLLMVSPQSPKSVVYVIGGLFGSMAIGWNGVFLAEVARIAKPELTGMATGGSLFFTFAGILTGLPFFSLIVQQTGSYPSGFAIFSITTFVCGLILLLSRSDEKK